ncbi:tetratricopeptide repeat protein [Thermococcus sp.]|uniref:tetratricopeptide repeat protein n=1 Tax=Thermococcus sp. TaxID=35749 RepID=UPI0025D91BA9|nr:tetratricopeptide repeat protein [Thermococcus sp.]
MKGIEDEWEKALTGGDCERLLELFDDYFDTLETEEELERELNRLSDVVVECEDPYDLAEEVAHLYSHLNEVEKGVGLYRRILERKRGNDEEYAAALYYMADAYDHLGIPEKALETYETLLELEERVGNEKEVALTLANMAIVRDELGEYEEALKLMEKARGIFERLGDEKNLFISYLDLAHFHYELGNYDEAEVFLREIYKSPRDNEVEANARLIEAEIWAGRGDYRRAFLAIRDALLKGLEGSDELFGLVFDTLVDFIEGLFSEGAYETVAGNMGVFAELFEDDTEYFFRAVGELAKWRNGEEGAKERFDEFYGKVENEELREVLDDWKRPKLSLGLEL